MYVKHSKDISVISSMAITSYSHPFARSRNRFMSLSSIYVRSQNAPDEKDTRGLSDSFIEQYSPNICLNFSTKPPPDLRFWSERRDMRERNCGSVKSGSASARTSAKDFPAARMPPPQTTSTVVDANEHWKPSCGRTINPFISDGTSIIALYYTCICRKVTEYKYLIWHCSCDLLDISPIKLINNLLL